MIWGKLVQIRPDQYTVLYVLIWTPCSFKMDIPHSRTWNPDGSILTLWKTSVGCPVFKRTALVNYWLSGRVIRSPPTHSDAMSMWTQTRNVEEERCARRGSGDCIMLCNCHMTITSTAFSLFLRPRWSTFRLRAKSEGLGGLCSGSRSHEQEKVGHTLLSPFPFQSSKNRQKQEKRENHCTGNWSAMIVTWLKLRAQ